MKLLYLILFLTSCDMSSNPFWKQIEVDLKKNQQIDVIENRGDSIIYIAGKTSSTDQRLTNDIPYIKTSTNYGETWSTKQDFDCNQIEALKIYKNVFVVIGRKFTQNSFQSTQKFAYIHENNFWRKLEIPCTDFSNFWILNEGTFVLKKSVANTFLNSYLITNDGGNTWKEKSINLKERSYFSELKLVHNKLWGINSSFDRPEETELLSIDLNNFKIESRFSLNAKEDVKAIENVSNNIFLLEQEEKMAKIKKLSTEGKNFKIIDSIALEDGEYVENLFLYNNYEIIISAKENGTFTKFYLNYKTKGGSWLREPFPEYTYPIFSFNNGTLSGVAGKDKIYLKKFSNDGR